MKPATKVKRRAEALPITHANLFRVIGRSSTYLGRWIRDGVPAQLPAEDARRLATYLGIPPERLGGVGDHIQQHAIDLCGHQLRGCERAFLTSCSKNTLFGMSNVLLTVSLGAIFAQRLATFLRRAARIQGKKNAFS